jgi:hypothetical protein
VFKDAGVFAMGYNISTENVAYGSAVQKAEQL